jgi:V8-like Glu-specific endopeptidase
MNSFSKNAYLFSAILFLQIFTACTNNGSAINEISRSYFSKDSSRGAIFLSNTGQETRVPMTSTAFPWSAIGRITLMDGKKELSTCTGTMVGRSVMVTAAHCVLDNGQFKTVRFEAGYNKGKYIISSYSGLIKVGTFAVDDDIQNDWAVVQLLDPIGDKVGWLGFDDIHSNYLFPIKVSYSGYSDNFQNSEVAGADSTCFIHEFFDTGTYGHDCSTGPGGSGGALFANDKVLCINTRGVKNGVFKNYSSKDSNTCVMNRNLFDSLIEFKDRFTR